MSFSTDLPEDEEQVASGKAYIDMLNEQSADAAEPQTVVSEAEAPAPQSSSRSSKSKGGSKKRGRPKKDDSGLKSL